jgi:dienelactone hydrolase
LENSCIMKNIFLYLIVFLIGFNSISQELKPAIDTNCFHNWQTARGFSSINSTGKYVHYQIYDQYSAMYTQNCGINFTTVLQSTQTNWKIEIPGSTMADLGDFTHNGQHFVFKNNNDSLIIIDLESKEKTYIPDVETYRLINNDIKNLVCYTSKRAKNRLVVFNLESAKKNEFSSVSKYWLAGNMQKLLLKIDTNESGLIQLTLFDLVNNTSRNIFQGTQVGNVTIDDTGNHIAFSTLDNLNQVGKNIWYYNNKNNKIYTLGNEFALNNDLKNRFQDNSKWSFSADKSKLFIQLSESDENVKRKVPSTNIKIWSYADPVLPSEQTTNKTKTYTAFIDIKNKQLVQVTKDNEMLVQTSNNFMIIAKPKSHDHSKFVNSWNQYLDKSYDLLNLRTNIRLALDSNYFNSDNIYNSFSPNGDFLVGYDYIREGYISFETATGIYRDISKGLKNIWIKGRFIDEKSKFHYSPITWSKDFTSFFVYDVYDIWQFDVTGKRSPRCITNGFGKKYNLTFYFLSEAVIDISERLTIFAFNNATKQNGFYQLDFDENKVPVELTMDDNLYQLKQHTVHSFGYIPSKAKFADAYLVQRMNAKQSPNYFYTEDFKIFKQLSFVYPEKKYNWLTSELHSWKSLTNRGLEGVLYKPENFNLKKKYPVIIHYYEKESDGLNCYWAPDPGQGDLSISYFVSNNYLVFYADITYDKRGTAINAYEAIQSAYHYLAKMPFVDSTKIGIQGNSQGGINTNNILTRSNSFAAACTSAGYIDLIAVSGRLQELYSGPSLYKYFTDGQMGTKEFLWDNKQKYIESSPIFELNKITTPVLMEYGTKDLRFYLDGIEFFTAMRLLGKKAWLLEYIDIGHGPFGHDAIDYTLRMYQFFNHYLRDEPAPNWMVESLPVSEQDIEEGLKLDQLKPIF